MTRPNIQVDDDIREMSEEEYAAHLEATNETPSPD
jgi:hypothetical protein